MEPARQTSRFDLLPAQAPSLAPQDASFVDALLAMPASIPEDVIDRAALQRVEIELARRLRAVIEQQA